MKYTILTLALLCSAITSFSQHENPEFTHYANGLIYDDTTISRLKHIVDSLHIRYKKCDLTRTYYSLPQAKGFSIKMDTGNLKAALHDIQSSISLGDFIKRYPLAVIDSGILFTLTKEIEDSVLKLEYRQHTADKGYDGVITLQADKADKEVKDEYGSRGRAGKWVYQYSRATEYSSADIAAYYIETPVKAIALPDRYAARILYADCMIDTTTDIFLPNAVRERWDKPDKSGSKYEAFMQYIQDNSADSIFKNSIYWADSALDEHIKNKLSLQPQFKKLLAEAVEEALKFGYNMGDWFEYIAGAYYSKKAALTLKRGRRIMGMCSQDTRPRDHLFSIALLAAETADWQVFLRAHLDIMNDRVARASDGSYAWGRRLTYIKELEDLDINVHELMLAICFAVDNPASNHYFGSIDRLGRAFSEAKDRPKLEKEILTMIADNELDDLNRLRMHYLFLNYVYQLPKKQDRLAALPKLEEADKKLPFYMYSRLEINREEVIGEDEKE